MTAPRPSHRPDSAPALAGELVTPAMYAALLTEVDDLAARSSEPNVFADPAVVGAIARTLGDDATIRIALARETGTASPGRLVGALPVRFLRRGATHLLPTADARLHGYTVTSTPLLDAASPGAFAALLDAVAAAPEAPALLAMPFLADRGPARSALDAAASSGRTVAIMEAYTRGRLDARLGGSQNYLAERLAGQKRKKHRNERKKLDAVFVRHRGADAVDAFEAFLALEAAGWKGRAGTAIVCNPVDAGFMRRAVAALAMRGQAEIVALERGRRPLAMGLVLAQGGAHWFHKIAYDETEARLSPGGHLAHDVTVALLDEPRFRFADSCTLRGAGMLEGAWTGEQPIADLLVRLNASRATFQTAVMLERAKRAARAVAKDVYLRLKRR